jgi:hypothetical protein
VLRSGIDAEVKLYDAPPELVRRATGMGRPLEDGFPAGGLTVSRKRDVWDLITGQLRPFRQRYKGQQECVFSPDSRRVVQFYLTGEPGTVQLVDTTNDKTLCTLKIQQIVERSGGSPKTSFSPNGRHVAVLYRDEAKRLTAKVLDAEKGRELHTLRPPAEPSSTGRAALSPGGKCLALGLEVGTGKVGERTGIVTLQDTASGRVLHTLPLPVSDMEVLVDLAFSPDGGLLAAVNRAGTVRVWDAATGQERFTVREPGNWGFAALAFRADGAALAVVLAVLLPNGKATATVWDKAGKRLRTTRLSDSFPIHQFYPSLTRDGRFLLLQDRSYHPGQFLMPLSLWEEPKPPAPVPDFFSALTNNPKVARLEFSRALIRLHDNWKTVQRLKEKERGGVDWFLARYKGHRGDWYSFGNYDDLIERFGTTEKAATAHAVARTCTLFPWSRGGFGFPVTDRTAALRLADKAAEADPKNYLYVRTHAAALIRAGKHNAGVARLNEAIRLNGAGGTVYEALFLALSRHMQVHADAGKLLARASEQLDAEVKAKRLSEEDLLELRMLREELKWAIANNWRPEPGKP